MARPAKAKLTPSLIVDAAMELIEIDGIEALSMRRLAAHIDVQAPSLYYYFATKDDVLDAVASRFYQCLDLSGFEVLDWRHAIESYYHSYWRAANEHRDFIKIVAFGRRARPEQLHISDIYNRTLFSAGWPTEYVIHISATVRSFVLGSLMAPLGIRFLDDPQVYDDYENLRGVHRLNQQTSELAERTFRLGLTLLLDSWEKLYEEIVSKDLQSPT